MKGLFQVLLSFALLLSVKFVPLIISHDTDGVNRGDVRDMEVVILCISNPLPFGQSNIPTFSKTVI